MCKVERNHKGMCKDLKAIEKGVAEQNLSPHVLDLAWKGLTTAKQGDVVRPRAEGRGTGPKGGAPNPRDCLKIMENVENCLGLVEKTSPPRSRERAKAEVKGGENGLPQKVDSLGNTGREEK